MQYRAERGSKLAKASVPDHLLDLPVLLLVGKGLLPDPLALQTVVLILRGIRNPTEKLTLLPIRQALPVQLVQKSLLLTKPTLQKARKEGIALLPTLPLLSETDQLHHPKEIGLDLPQDRHLLGLKEIVKDPNPIRQGEACKENHFGDPEPKITLKIGDEEEDVAGAVAMTTAETSKADNQETKRKGEGTEEMFATVRI
jgi:hypothetical protein